MPHHTPVSSAPTYPLPVSVTSSPLLISQNCAYFPHQISLRYLAPLPSTHTFPPALLFFCANFELHEITYHQRLSQALSFRAGNLSIHCSWKLRNMPGITLVRCDIMCEKTHSIPCFAFYVALCVFPPSLSILCPPMTNHLCPGEGYPSEKQSFSFFSIILSSFTAM